MAQNFVASMKQPFWHLPVGFGTKWHFCCLRGDKAKSGDDQDDELCHIGCFMVCGRLVFSYRKWKKMKILNCCERLRQCDS